MTDVRRQGRGDSTCRMGKKPRAGLKAIQVESPVSFPRITPRSVHSHLDQYRAECLIPDQIQLVHNFLTPVNRDHFLAFFKSFILPRLTEPVAPRRGEATRTNQRFSVRDPVFAASLFTDSGLDLCAAELGLDHINAGGGGGGGGGNSGRLVGLNPNVRIYRYAEGAFFGPHFDESVRDLETGWKSAWTLLIYLIEGHGGLVGGETAFHIDGGRVIAPPVTDGLALLHRHGDDCLLHEGRPVVKGVKWVLRSDLMYA